MKKVAVILSGCGFLDGAEITEAISTLIAIGQNDAEYKVFAPNKEVAETNHVTQKATGQKRNVLQEAAPLGHLNECLNRATDSLENLMWFRRSIHISWGRDDFIALIYDELLHRTILVFRPGFFQF